MKLGLLLFSACMLIASPTVCFGDDAALQACVEIYKNSTRDYSQTQQENVELARSFSSFCKKDGSVNTSATGVGLDAVVKAIPFKFSASNTSSQQKMEEFCKVGSSQYDSWSMGSTATSEVNTQALTNFNNCVQLANSGLQFRVSINQPNSLVINGFANAGYTGYISSVAYDSSTMTCSSADFNNAHRSVTLNGPVHLSTQNPFTITCTKQSQSQPDGSSFYQRSTLTIGASAVSPLAIVFPSDTLNGYELASQARAAVARAATEVTEAQASTATQKQIADSLQNRLNGVSVSVYAYDLQDSCFETGAAWGNGFRALVQKTCGTRPHGEGSNIRAGGTCGQGPVAFACVNIPQ